MRMANVSRASGGSAAGFWNSPRNQRRIFFGSAGVLILGAIVFVSLVVLRGTGNAFTDTFSNTPATIYLPQKHAPLSKDEITVAREFMATAVTRKNLDAAYDL